MAPCGDSVEGAAQEAWRPLQGSWWTVEAGGNLRCSDPISLPPSPEAPQGRGLPNLPGAPVFTRVYARYP